MAGTATNNGISLTVAQKQDPQATWNTLDWFDNIRWGLNGTQVDSDFKAGLWWQDAEDLKNARGALIAAGQQWNEQLNGMIKARDGILASQSNLATEQGAETSRKQSAMDDARKLLDNRIDAVRPLPPSFTNLVGQIDNGVPQIEALWTQWKNDRGNTATCHMDTLRMQPIMTNMMHAALDTAQALQKAYKFAYGLPNITTASAVNGNSSLDQATQAKLNADPTPAGAAPGTIKAQAPAAQHTPGVVAAGTGTAGTGGTGGTGTVTAGRSTAGTVVSSPNTTNGPSLAGSGFGSSFGGGGGGAGAAGFGGGAGAVPAAASAGPVSAGSTAPGFTPAGFMGVPGAGAGGVGGGLSGTRSGSPAAAPEGGTPLFPVTGGGLGTAGRSTRDDESTRGGSNGARGGAAAPPLIGGMGAGGQAGGRRGSEIRPGNANRPRTTSGVAEGLLGRAAKDSEFAEVVGSTRRRRPNKRQGSDQRETVQFLDEEAWLTDDPGSGVVTGEDAPARNTAPGSRFGTPSAGF